MIVLFQAHNPRAIPSTWFPHGMVLWSVTSSLAISPICILSPEMRGQIQHLVSEDGSLMDYIPVYRWLHSSHCGISRFNVDDLERVQNDNKENLNSIHIFYFNFQMINLIKELQHLKKNNTYILNKIDLMKINTCNYMYLQSNNVTQFNNIHCVLYQRPIQASIAST